MRQGANSAVPNSIINPARAVASRVSFALSITIFLLAAACPVTAQDLATKIDLYMLATHRISHFSGSIMIFGSYRMLVTKGYGMANYEWDVRNTPQTKFRLGSITKQFTAMAILQLQEKGKLDVQDSICKYISECPEDWQGIKIFNLLTHTSGIPNFTDFPDYKKTMMLPITVPELLARFKGKPLEFKPGEKFMYSNSGYEVLGAIVEKVSGEPYADYLEQNIFKPLKMRDTGYDSNQRIILRRASGYALEGSTLVNAPYIDMTIPYSAGGLYCTVEDLYRWDRALYTEKLVSRKTLDQMFTPYKGDYAMGWVVRTEFNHKLITHGGGINGFSTSIRRYPDSNACVIVLSNLQNADTEKISHDLAAILFHQPYDLPKEHHAVSVDPKIYDAYAGQYELAPDFILTVTREGDRLMTQATGQGKVEVFPETKTRFFLKVTDAQIDFARDASGNVTGLILHQGGHDRPANKIK